jgi:hypothetical protein
MTNREDADGSPATPGTAPHLIISLCGTGTCPTIYDTDRDTVLIQGSVAHAVSVPDGEALVEIPREILLEAARRLLDGHR